MKRIVANLVVCMMALFWTGCINAAEQQTNWLRNSSFEAARNNNPVGWRTQVWSGEGRFALAEIGHTGNRSVMIWSEKGGDLSWTVTVPVDPLATYRLSGWIKTEDLKPSNGRGALFNIHGMEGAASRALTGTNDWTKVEFTFKTADQDSVQVNCLYGGWGLATGRAWFDDLVLEKIGQDELPSPTITIDASKAGEPISPYIYGQFIEHMGRCIYGGIWAEMLEDRKFYFAVGAKESPWQAVGGGVVMVKENAFVGDHTPQVSLDGSTRGIAQKGLGLVAGKKYVGRVWLAGSGEAGPVTVSLVWGQGDGDRQSIRIDKVGDQFAKTEFEFTAGARTDDGRLEITSAGKGSLRIGTVSLMPADHVQGMRPDTLALLKELDSPVYRWPGGNFVSGYNWKDGIGERDRRPPRKNPAWTGVEHNDFGMDEFIVFCRLLNTEPYIAVNTGLGEVHSAVEEMEYANGSADTPMGKWRAASGHPEPYRVKWWGIGNEMYGNWQLGHMPLEKYVQKHIEFVEAMRKVDPSAKFIAVGAVGSWSETMMQKCAEHMDLISEHFYCQERRGLWGHVKQIPDNIRSIARAHRGYRERFDALKGKDIRIAMDEWNYWYGPHVFGELGTRYFLKDGLGIAAGLNEYARNTDIIFMANYAQTVNVIGAIKTNKTAAAMETTGLVLKLYRHQFGTIPVSTVTKGLIDAQAALTADRKTLTIAIVNPTTQKAEIPLAVSGVKLRTEGKRWQIAGDDPMAYNDPGKLAVFRIEESAVSGITDKLTVAPCSVTLFAVGVE